MSSAGVTSKAGLMAVALLAGCAQAPPPAASGGGAGGSAAAAPGGPCNRTVQNYFAPPAEKPAGFQDGFTVALVRQSGVGDYFEQWGRGAQAQIEAAGGKVTSYDARGDNARQVSLFNDAIAAKPKVIIVDHGLADSVNPKIDEAIDQGIPVVVYDVNSPTARRPTSRRTTSRSPRRSSTT